jgi:hypothetical protein
MLGKDQVEALAKAISSTINRLKGGSCKDPKPAAERELNPGVAASSESPVEHFLKTASTSMIGLVMKYPFSRRSKFTGP